MSFRLALARDDNPSNIFARARLVLTRHMTEYSPAKTGEYPRIFLNFQNCACCEEYLKDNKHNSLHLAQKYARIFVLGHLFLKAYSFSRTTLSENRSLLGTDNVRGQISEHIFAYFRDVMCIRSIVSLGGWGCKMLLFRTQIPNGQASVCIEWDLDTILGDCEQELVSIYLIVHTV